MGTNYYLDIGVCPHCKQPSEKLHLGKSSAGWVFMLHVYPEKNLNDLEDIVKHIEDSGGLITDEYGRPYTIGMWLLEVVARSWPKCERDDHWYKSNHAQPGPNNLSRSTIDGIHTIGHGLGTWDCCTGDFS